MVKIAIDATALPPNPVGAGVYIVHLVRALAELDAGEEFVIFAQKIGCDLIGVPERPGFRWVVLPDRSPSSRLLWEQTTFPRLLRREAVDLLHSLHYTRPVFLPCASVVTFHDMTFFLFPHLHTRSKRVFFPNAIRLSARLADALIADSESARLDSIRLAGVPPQKITTVHLGVTEDFHPIHNPEARERVRRQYDLPAEFLLYVGLVEPRKNLPMLIRAFARVAAENPQQHLVVVGRLGWMYADVFRQVEQLGLKNRIHFPGYVPREDLPIVYNLAGVFIYPTIYEGFGLPVLEAMACGTATISTAVSSIPEIAGEAALLVPPGDEPALAAAILKLAGDPELRANLSAAGAARARQFTWEKTARETLEIYRNVLTRSGKK